MARLVIYVYLVILSVSSVTNEDRIGKSWLGGPLSQKIDTNAERHPAADFSRHTLVKPKIYHGREKRQISSTKEENGVHTNHLQVALEIDGKDMVLDLTLNKQLIPKGFFHKHQENGKYKVHKPTAQEVDLCQYNGKVRGRPDSWVALSTCDGLSGVIFDGEEMHYVEKDDKAIGEGIGATHFLYKHSDLAEHNKTCGYAGDTVDHEEDHLHHHNRILRYKRDTDQNEPLVRGPYNANKESKYVELVLVLDNQEYKELGESRTRVLNHAKTIANIVNGLYSPLNIFIALVGVVIWSERDEIVFSTNGDTTLTNFLHYRRGQLIKEHPNDNAQLLTKFNFDNGVVGKALRGPICTYQFSGGVNTDHSTVVGLVATTIAHEMGHNFGMEHDKNECKCPDDRCIMAPSSSTVAPTHWSSCSLNYLLLAFTHGMDYCLKNKPKSLFDSPVCGNGFVEPGEQCDCGLPEHCDNTCCNATTCMLYSNASCATGECCDLTTCRPKNAGTLCRSADLECDLPEYCTGQSEYCPADIYKIDTEVCDGGKAYCYHGFCRTRTDQCKLLWGETGKSSDEQCYKMNVKGDRHGNCGYNMLTNSYAMCTNESILCGMLHCKHLNERLEFGMESVAILSHTFINKKGSIIPCRTALVDLGVNQVDPGLAPDGSHCGEGKMCVNQKCMSVSSLRKMGPACPQDCNGNGWCNNKGHCHCKDGFAPPYCDNPGPGGSMDSGPASDPNAHQGLIAAMFIFFLGIVPLVAIVVFLYYYARQNFKFGKKKSSQATSKSPSKSRGPSFPSETTKRTEDNHSLLHEDSPPPTGLQNEFFGNFKGFSLSPAKKPEPEPIRAAPPPPVVPPPAPQVKTSPSFKAPPSVATATVKTPSINRFHSLAAKTNLFNKPVQKTNSFKSNTLSNGIATVNGASVAPALPPPNPGSSARPIISSPVLENSTCTAKELISPLRNAPKVPLRPAPETPVPAVEKESKRPLSSPDASQTVLNIKISEDLKKPPKEKESSSALNRITSFLKPTDKKPVVQSNSLPKTSQVKANKVLDKDALRSMEISNPIPQTKIEIAITALPVNTEASKTVVMRAQSMRVAKDKPKPHIQTFGSMRQPSGFKRPLSIPSGVRPKSPPPPRPPGENVEKAIKTVKGAESNDLNQYDDCLNEAAPLAKISEGVSPTSGDNIYAVIEESPVSPQSPEKVTSGSGSSDSMGLLGEIVSEIQNRNFDSIYSTSTLARKKKEEEEKLRKQRAGVASPDPSEIYVNTSSLAYAESEYSNMSGNIKSSASSTSSGYIHPSAVNVPIKAADPKPEEKPPSKPNLSSFKSESTKPFSSTFNRPQGPVASSFKTNATDVKKVEASSEKRSNKSKTPPSPTTKTPPSPTIKAAPKAPINRQVTPPNLRTRKPSPTRAAPQGPKTNNRRSITNSPDLVTSCNANPAAKPPDVLNRGTTARKPAISNSKPTADSLNKVPGKINQKAVSFKSPQEKKGDVKPPVASKINKANSDVGAIIKTSVGLRNAARQSSNVASLQQKFENKSNVSSAEKVKA
ncbi:disintegrin and metalloproteinase domain-containing protein 12 [Anoplophora glabripennis]|nr:disintegrin and metalloproteinase domain-containing protein 12 [Anoplophora glabripennis]